MDELSAHLDRGWDLLQKGDLRGARASARRALEADKESPEAHNLLGYVAAQEGDADEALEHYRSAMALDDGFIDPMLNAAEVLIHPLHEYDEAIDLCDEVLEFAEGNEEIADALLLKFDALLGKGERDAAKKVLDLLPEGPFEGPTYPFLLGRALFEAGERAKALPHLQKAVESDPNNPDAHYYLGLLLDEQKDARGATLAFLEAREIDLDTPRPSWSLPRDAFQKTVERAFGALPAEIVSHLDKTLVLVADVPGMEIVCDGVDPRIPVLLDGVQQPGESGPLAARVFVYQRNIERLCGGIEQLEDEIAYQITEEVKHVLEHRERDESPSDKPPTRGTQDARTRDRDRDRERERDKDDESKPASRPRKS
jgi:tetratricopeptide (TPR) repeat protein